ncbi:ABC transporter substrate-binding protein [Pusillimonas caeni]|uniref:ABC transporter substrate-binding protein n=1 Tax=Pusillimonas caeni TaxID=1348472 RepID=UPI000E59E24A|nr:ABC transporter substrate-binding protein [Pusillimonas caeni]TFL13089.1 ABC transporter substrate-binding protein [Pusillimonas caeni]
MTIDLSLACGRYDRTGALLDGRVGIEGCRVTAVSLRPEETFFRVFTQHEFDVAELSFSTYLIQTARGECEYIAIPAFVSRAFRHSGFYVRTDRVSWPGDLRGKRVGVPEYQVTAAVWGRGILQHEYGIPPSGIRWVVGGVEELGRQEKVSFDHPPGVEIVPATDLPLSRLLASGEIDAILAPRTPSCFRNKSEHVGRLFPDPRSVEADYFKRTGIFPIMHVVGIRKSLVQKHPWLAASAMKAFLQARAVALPSLDDTTALATSLPWLNQEAEFTRSVMGDDPWPYGVEQNAKTLDAMLSYHHEQGLSLRKLALEEVFHPGSLQQFKI